MATRIDRRYLLFKLKREQREEKKREKKKKKLQTRL